MSIKVGINKNLQIAKVVRNEKNTLVLTLQEGKGSAKALLNGTGTSSRLETRDFMFFPPTVEYQGAKKDSPVIMGLIIELKNSLELILEQFMTTDKIKWELTFGLGISDNEDIEELIKDQGVVDKIYSNLVEQFMAQVKPFVGDGSPKTNWILIRKSSDSHYPKIRNRYVKDNPFVERAEVPAEESKLKFTDFEVRNGLNIADPVQKAQPVSKEEADHVKSLFSE